MHENETPNVMDDVVLFLKLVAALLLFVVGVTVLGFTAGGKYIANYNYSHPKLMTCTVESAEPAAWGLSEEQLNEKNRTVMLKIQTKECGVVRYSGFAYGKSLNEMTSYINEHAGQEISFKVPSIWIKLNKDAPVGAMKIGELDYDRWDVTTNTPEQ